MLGLDANFVLDGLGLLFGTMILGIGLLIILAPLLQQIGITVHVKNFVSLTLCSLFSPCPHLYSRSQLH